MNHLKKFQISNLNAVFGGDEKDKEKEEDFFVIFDAEFDEYKK